jgi:hypothetical protein
LSGGVVRDLLVFAAGITVLSVMFTVVFGPLINRMKANATRR